MIVLRSLLIAVLTAAIVSSAVYLLVVRPRLGVEIEVSP